jgi:hypothetical protein
MTRKDWTCAKCGGERQLTPSGFITCSQGCEKLLPRKTLKDLPKAVSLNTNKWKIAGSRVTWKYAVRMHKGCMDRSPLDGHVVALIKTKRGLEPRTFVAVTPKAAPKKDAK